ncbi:hypothetical protein B0O99DRAFT_628191 [Bisporella sp. PMI_857]|nr:hypothetical protein B0O99DRAFT_628191 [Bisporella sp. PMI_857]
MATVAEIRSQLRLCDENLTVEKLFEEPTVVALLTRIFESLTPESKDIVRDLFSRATNGSETRSRSPIPQEVKTKRRKTQHYLTAILEIKVVALPAEVNEQFIACKRNPSAFWRRGHQMDSKSATRDLRQYMADSNIDIAIAQAYLSVKKLSIQRKWDTIVWRFYTLFFYELALLLGNGGVRLTKNLLNRLLKVISAASGISDDNETIATNLRKWTAVGFRYYKLSTSLGAGALFLLPHLPDITWEDNSLIGETYKAAISHLISCKICELSESLGANDVAIKIRAAALEPFQWNIEKLYDGNIERPHSEDISEPATRVSSFPERQKSSDIQNEGLERSEPGDSPIETIISSAPVGSLHLLCAAVVQTEQGSTYDRL